MDGQTVKLYGYNDERARIEAAIAGSKELRVVCLHGPGGMGKTTMLLAVLEAYRSQPAYRITCLLDFDDLRLRILHNILNEIARQFDSPQTPFADYFAAYTRLREMQRQDVSHLRVEDQDERTREAFVQCYRALSGQQRSILLFDTVEKVQDYAVWHELTELLIQLDNIAVLLAGRRNADVGASLQIQLSAPDAVQIISLGGLSPTDALAYFQRTPLGESLAHEDPVQAKRVCQLSAGRPILIDLAVDWLGQGMKLPMPAQETPEASSSSADIQEFEQALVAKISDLSQPVNEAILDMAHIYHYFDAERYSYLHAGLSPTDNQKLFEELGAFSFVKPQPGGGIRLHDEMQRMVAEHAWPILDKSGARRRWLSERMVEYYAGCLGREKDDQIRWQTLTAEQMYHRLYADLEQGHQAFMPIFRQAISRHWLGFAHVLLNSLKEFRAQFSPPLQAWADIHAGRLLRAEEKVQEAIDLIRPAKERLQTLGVRHEMDTVCNVLGYCYRLLGDWDKAIYAYEEALAYSREEHDVEQIAETMNNIANACRLSGDLEQANRYSLLGLKIRERSGDPRAIGNSCYVRGIICWEMGNTAEAADYSRRARQLFSEASDIEGIAEVDRHDSYMHFRTGDLDEALRLLRQARAVFAERGIGPGLADTLNLEARIIIDRVAAAGGGDEDFRDVERLANEALRVAERIHDQYKIAECHLSLCRLFYYWGRYLRFTRHDETGAQRCYRLSRQQYDDPKGGQLAQQRNYLALQSVYEWVMGDIAFEMQDWDTAFDHYVRESAIASRHKEPRFARALNGLSDRLHRLPQAVGGSRDLTRHYCDYVIAKWKAQGLSKDFPEVIEECEHIKTFLGLVDPEHLARLRQQGTDLLARGEWQRAVSVYQELLKAGQTYTPGEEVAEAMNQSAWAYRQMGHFAQARRLCQQALLIRQRLNDPSAIASSWLVMGTIMWVTGNTTEAARYLRLARQLYEEAQDEIGLARVNRHMAFLHFRIADHQKALEYVTQAEAVFRAQALPAELADALNLHTVILRREGRHEEAQACGQESRRLAEETGAQYTLAEIWLTLGFIEYEAGHQAREEGNVEAARRHFEQEKLCRANGYPIAERNSYNLLLSVYEANAAAMAFDEGRYAAAFDSFVRDLDFGARYERARMRRELDRIVDRLVQLAPDMRRYYADYLINEWQGRNLAEAEPDVPRLFQLLKEYSEYV